MPPHPPTDLLPGARQLPAAQAHLAAASPGTGARP